MNQILFYIVLTIVMPEGQPDITYRHQEPSYQQCLADSKEFLDHQLPDNIKNPLGRVTACEVRGFPPHENM